MKKLLFIFCLFLLGSCLPSILVAQPVQMVEYLSDSIAMKDGEYIRLLSGSSWILASPSLALAYSDIIIVFQEIEIANLERMKVAVAYVEGEEILVKHVAGQFITDTGYLTTVIDTLDDGAVLKMADGSLFSVPSYDQYYTSWWLPPYKVLLTGSKLYLWNLKKGKRIWVSPLK